ncbi:MAG: hypothetical protein EKK48_10260 [Candidatus Melainabacteria bacterium]|nr:MAG: hypothetical protein EKK48_10260 [Candidatus Melainabacteria bacterium]
MHKSILNKVAPVVECIAPCSVFLEGRLIALSIKPTDRGLSALIGSLILSLLLVNTMAAQAEVEQSPAPVRGVHCDFERVNKFSKFNKIRLAIMSADGIVVHSDLAGRYNASRALVTGTVSYMVSIDVNGKILSMRLADSSGNERNDAIAARLIRAVSPLKTEPPYEGALKILFQHDGDLVKVLPMSSPTVSGAIKSCVPPFPVLVPLNQQDYERALSPEDAGWIQRTTAEIMHQLNNRNLNVVGTRCLMEISSAGTIVAPVYFSSPLPEERHSKYVSAFLSLSSLPKFSSGNSRYVLVGFDDRGQITSFRLPR